MFNKSFHLVIWLKFIENTWWAVCLGPSNKQKTISKQVSPTNLMWVILKKVLTRGKKKSLKLRIKTAQETFITISKGSGTFQIFSVESTTCLSLIKFWIFNLRTNLVKEQLVQYLWAGTVWIQCILKHGTSPNFFFLLKRLIWFTYNVDLPRP